MSSSSMVRPGACRQAEASASLEIRGIEVLAFNVLSNPADSLRKPRIRA